MIGLSIGIPFRRGASYPAILDDGNTVLWLDYKIGVTKDGSDLVSRWDDRLGGNYVEQLTTASQPELTSTGVLFD